LKVGVKGRSKLEQLEQRIHNLPSDELARFSAWFIEFDHLIWGLNGSPEGIAREKHSLANDWWYYIRRVHEAQVLWLV
jgi:hypothetical protein